MVQQRTHKPRHRPLPRQPDFFGSVSVAGSIADKVQAVLEDHPEARNDYMLAMFYFWVEFEGLEEVLGDRVEDFRDWWLKATSPKTLQNRCMEIQNRYHDLDADPQVERLRQAQSKAGPVGS
jgi:hypothetical protein